MLNRMQSELFLLLQKFVRIKRRHRRHGVGACDLGPLKASLDATVDTVWVVDGERN